VPPPSSPSAASPGPTAAPAGGLGLAEARRTWPDLLEEIKKLRRFTWILLSQNAQVIGLDGNVLTLGMKNAGARESFTGSGSDEVLRRAANQLLGVDWTVETIVDPSTDPGAQTAPRVITPAVAPDPPAPASGPAAPASAPSSGPSSEPSPAPSPGPTSDPVPATGQGRPDRRPTPPEPGQASDAVRADVRSRIAPTRQAGEVVEDTSMAEADAAADPDDPDVVEDAVDSQALLERELGATMIDEINHDQ